MPGKHGVPTKPSGAKRGVPTGTRRTPRRDKQTARGKGMPSASETMSSVNRAMKRGRHKGTSAS